MPTMSRSRANPSCTPLTALATRARVRPCRARSCLVSPSRVKLTTPAASDALIPAGSAWVREAFPFSTTTARPWIFTLTPAGTAIGIRPIRDIVRPSPDVAKNLAAHARLARLGAAHHAARRRDDVDPQTAHDQGDLLMTRVDTLPRLADHGDPGEVSLPLVVVPQDDPDRLEAALLDLGDLAHVPFLLQHLGNGHLVSRMRDLDPGVSRAEGIAHPRQHVSDRIDHGSLAPSPARFRDAGDQPLQRQVPEADPAHFKTTQESARPAAPLATIAVADGVLRLLSHRRDPGFCGHCSIPRPLVAAERHSHQAEQVLRFLVGLRGGDDRDV